MVEAFIPDDVRTSRQRRAVDSIFWLDPESSVQGFSVPCRASW